MRSSLLNQHLNTKEGALADSWAFERPPVDSDEAWRPLNTPSQTKWRRPKTTGGRWTRRTWWSIPGTWSSPMTIPIILLPLPPPIQPQWPIHHCQRPMLDLSLMRAKSKLFSRLLLCCFGLVWFTECCSIIAVGGSQLISWQRRRRLT